MNKNIAVFGAQIGDEAKARSIHSLSKYYNYCVRFSSGGNAGHTIYYNGKKIVRHLIPSTDFSIPNNKAFLGAGMVIDPDDLLKEVKETLETFPGAASKIIVDPDAFVVFQKHINQDIEKNKHIGSTNKGITPCYTDKIGRVGTKIRQLINDNHPSIIFLKELGVQFKHSLELYDEFIKSDIIFEGSQSVQLDLNFGNYPFVTSGECALGGIYNAGFAFCAPSKVYGVAKPYVTKAGGGIGRFLTEMPAEEGRFFAEKGLEIGATTSRPRRIGYLDMPALKYSVIKGGITNLIITKLDILNGLKSIKICHEYDKPIVCGNDLETAHPKYIEMSCWDDASKFKTCKSLQSFLEYIGNYTGADVEYISFGVNEHEFAKLNQ